MMLDLKSLVDMMSIGTLMAYMIVRLERKKRFLYSLNILVFVFYFFITKWRRIRRMQILQNTQRETPIH